MQRSQVLLCTSSPHAHSAAPTQRCTTNGLLLSKSTFRKG